MEKRKAPACDGINAELIMNGPTILRTKITVLLSLSSDGGEDIEYEHGTIVPFQKPGKAKVMQKTFIWLICYH